jgi:hypothetical protein
VSPSGSPAAAGPHAWTVAARRARSAGREAPALPEGEDLALQAIGRGDLPGALTAACRWRARWLPAIAGGLLDTNGTLAVEAMLAGPGRSLGRGKEIARAETASAGSGRPYPP